MTEKTTPSSDVLVRLKKRLAGLDKPRAHPFFKKLRARQDSRTRTLGDNIRCEEGKWNYERARAQRGSVVVGVSPAPAAWSRGLEGQRLRCVKVFYNGDEFYLDDSTGWGTEKVFKRGGGPDSPHRTIHVDDPTTFIPDTEPGASGQSQKDETSCYDEPRLIACIGKGEP